MADRSWFGYIVKWLHDEREYQTNKFDYTEQDDTHTRDFLNGLVLTSGELFWDRQINTYIHRAQVLGIDTPAGRQAVLKAAATTVAFAESVVRMYGIVPEPGVTSGEKSP